MFALLLSGVVQLDPEPEDLLVAGFALGATLAIAGALVWWQREAFDATRLSLPGVFMLTYYTFMAVPSVAIFLERPSTAATDFLIAALSPLVLFPLGVLLVRSRERGRRMTPDVSVSQAPSAILIPAERTLSLLWSVGFAVSLVIVAGYWMVVQTIPLVELILRPGDVGALVLLREESFKLLPVPLAYVFSWSRSFFLPFIGLAALLVCRTAYRTHSWRARALTSFVIALLFAGASSAKAPMIYILLMFAGLWYLTQLERRALRLSLPLAAAAVLIFAFIEQQVYGQDLVEGFGAFVNRALYLPALTVYHYFLIFPDIVPFQYGQTIRLLTTIASGFIDVSFFDPANYAAGYIAPYGIATASANASYVGSAWVDFAWFGVAGYSLLLGAVTGLLQRHIDARKTIWTVSLHAFLLVPLGFSVLSISLTSVLLSDGVLIAALVAVLLNRYTLGSPGIVASAQGRGRRPAALALQGSRTRR